MKNKYMVVLLCIVIFLSIISIAAVTKLSKTSNDNELYKDTYNLGSYLTHLQEYISTSETSLSIENESKFSNLLQELAVVSNLEKKDDIQQMSIDGRDMAMSLLKNIYGLYGAKIEFSIDGEIRKVNDSTGNLIYEKEDTTNIVEFQIINLIIVLCIILILFSLSLLLTRNSKILVKDGDIDGYDKKKYA